MTDLGTIFILKGNMAQIKLKSQDVILASIEAYKAFTEQKYLLQEPFIVERMDGFYGLFKCTREEAIKKLKRDKYSDYNFVLWKSQDDVITKRLLTMAVGSEDGYVYVNEIEWEVIKKFY